MAKAMKKSRIPQTDSIQELAEFWDSHDLTAFEEELEEAPKPVFVGGRAIRLHLEPAEAEAVRRKAEAKGVSPEELIRSWVRQKLVR